MVEHKGFDSLWNEATFKSARLNSIQELLNDLRLEPLSLSPTGKFNYEVLYSVLDVLYHEGYSKYSTKERKEVDEYMNAIQEIILLDPPATKVYKEQIGGKITQVHYNTAKLSALLHLLKEFERKIKHYHDKHGLTTSNKEYSGLF